jgi:NADH-quinone oxidoreductase subunit G
MPKLTIDGKEIEVPKGTRVIEAAKKLDFDVPYYCYHPGLSIAGNCRMCLVEVEKMPKLQIACHMECTDGMVVKTNTEKVLQTRKHILEFLLINHPLDCPVCDQAGECWLQDYYMKHGLYDSRLNEDKVKKPKAVPIGPTVILDAERCILCSRCVRFTDEISKTSELGIINRGDHSEITVFPGKELDNPYSGCVVDICPVGALTDRDFRFKTRVWYLQSEDSICNGCSRGCNIQVQYNLDRPHHAKGERIKRLKPRFNENINKWWMCDEGRYSYKTHEHNRILEPVHRGKAEYREPVWHKILPEIAKCIINAAGKIAVFLSPQLSNEELYLARKFFKEELKLKNVYLVSPQPAGFQDDILIRADKNPNSKGAEVLGFLYQDQTAKNFLSACEKGEVKGAIVFGSDILTRLEDKLVSAAFQKLDWSLFVGPNHNSTSEYAAYVLPSAAYVEKEGTFTNFEGRVQQFKKVLEPLGDSLPEWRIMIALARELGIHFHYDRAEEIFHELARELEFFKGLTYENLATAGSDVRTMAAPTIPALEQDANFL